MDAVPRNAIFGVEEVKDADISTVDRSTGKIGKVRPGTTERIVVAHFGVIF